MKKRDFLKQISKATIASPLLSFNLNAPDTQAAKPYDLDTEEGFWKRIRADYSLKKDYINLENGWYNFIPNPTLEKFIGHVRKINLEASYYMRTVQYDDKKRIAGRIAGLVGCKQEELILTRNATESLDLIIGGYPWKAGDEAIMAEQDYGSMLDMFRLVAENKGIVNKIVSIPNHPGTDEEIVSLYEKAITAKTRLIMVSHMINITGQILPVRKICDMAHKYGVEVLVDGAHCVAHIKVDIPELHCDYYASSLHKWLSTPLGVGMLYIEKSKIPQISPLFGSHVSERGDISRLNHTGTHPVHTDLAIDNAMDYFEMIGLERKEKRLRYLQRYWSDQLRQVENIVLNTPEEDQRSCGIANVGITHIEPGDLARTLLEEFKIFTVAIDYAGVRGCRVTPNVFTTTQELEQFVSAMKAIASRG